MENEKFMRLAIELSIKNIDCGGGPFGEVIVKNGEIIAKSANSHWILTLLLMRR